MEQEIDRTRALGRLGAVQFGPDLDHGGCPVFTANVHGIGGTQGFQLTFDDEGQMRAFVRDFYAIFDVTDAESLVGSACYALRCFNRSSEAIEGIESVATGKRITKTAWWRANVDPALPSPLYIAAESIRSTIARHERQLEEERGRLATLASVYTSWDPPSPSDVVAENAIRFGRCACPEPKRLRAQSTFCATCQKVIS